MPFPYQKVLIIGATSGIGQALADKMHSAGISVLVTGRRSTRLSEFTSKHPGSHSYTLDLTALDSIPSFAATVTKDHPDLDCILLNSGMQRSFTFTDPATLDLDQASLEITTNYLSYLHVVKAFAPFLQAKSSPTAFLFMSSGLALLPLGRVLNYSASKAALHSFVMGFREQMRAGKGDVRVVEIFPPAVQTELHSRDNQPDIEDPDIGIPLAEFLDEAWRGLENEEENVPVGLAKRAWEGFEGRRFEAVKKFQGI